VGAQAFFLPATPGQRFCIYQPPAADAALRGAVLYLHPWAEEMNKSRRMAALHARDLSAAGYAVLQIDLHGCGDSSDTWAEASWAGWVDDAVLAARWLLQRTPATVAQPLWLWGLRAGALLAAQTAQRLQSDVDTNKNSNQATPCNLLFWQPAPSGKLLLQQFLRLKMAAGLQAEGPNTGKGVVEALRTGLAAGQAQDIAGYTLSTGLAQGLDAAVLAPPNASTQPGRVVWLEVSTRTDASVLPASQPRIEQWQAAGHTVHTQVVTGPAFWQTVEIEDAPTLLQASLAAMTGAPSTASASAPATVVLEAQA